MAVRVAPLALAALLLGCTASTETTTPSTTTAGGSSIPASTVPPSTVGTTSTTPAPNPGFSPEQQEIADAYQNAMAVFDRVGIRGGIPVDRDLDATMVDPMLNDVRVQFTNAYDRDERIRFPADSRHKRVVESVAIEGGTATIAGCTVDDAIVYKVSTGEIVNDNVSTADFVARMVRVDGIWKLAAREPHNYQAGEQPCP